MQEDEIPRLESAAWEEGKVSINSAVINEIIGLNPQMCPIADAAKAKGNSSVTYNWNMYYEEGSDN